MRKLLDCLTRSSWHRLVLVSCALSVVLVSIAWVITWQRLAAEKQLLQINVQQQQENLAAVIAENLNQVIDRGRLLAITASGWFDGKPAETAQQLGAMRSVDKAFLRLAIYDRNLHAVYASSPGDSSPALVAAMHTVLDRAAGNTGLAIGPEEKSDEASWQIPLLLPIVDARGETQGVLQLVLDMGYFLQLYHPIKIGRTGFIQILNDKGEAIAEASQAGLLMQTRQPRIAAELLGTASCRDDIAMATVDSAYSACFKPLDNYPLLIAVGRSQGEIFAQQAASQRQMTLTLGGVTLFILLSTLWIVRSISQQRSLFRALEAAHDDKQLLIAQLEEEKRRAIDLAAHDHLTGLHNRRMFKELATSHISRARRSRKHYALMYIDLDRFKNINDTLGHHVGDLLLQRIADRLRSTLRESDLIARLGGDEFACLLTGLESIDDAAVIAGKIIEEISAPCPNLDGHEIQVSPSIGIAIFPRDGQDEDALCRHADVAMYRAKESGRGRFVFYDATLNPAHEQLFNLEQRLPAAIAGNELRLHFQPKVRLSDYQIIGLEALVRWQHPEFGLVYPGDFIPLAEASGHIVALGDWVAEACCRQLAEWQARQIPVVPVAFNVSPWQLRDGKLAERIAQFAARHAVDPALLEIEITESVLVDSFVAAEQSLRAIESLGVGIALDDFGSGFSSLGYIRHLPIHCIKIDRSFIGHIRESRDDAVIVDSMITLAHNLGIRVVAEGVEMFEQIRHLKTAGCDQAQGYCLSRPVPADTVVQLLQRSILVPT